MLSQRVAVAVAITSAVSSICAFALGALVTIVLANPGTVQAKHAAANSADVGPATATPPAPASVIQAQQFELVDANGKVEAVWGHLSPQPGFDWLNGMIGLSLLDTDGKPTAMLGLSPDDYPVIFMSEGRTGMRVTLGITPDGAARLVFADPSGPALRAGIAALPDGTSSFGLYESQGRAAVVSAGRGIGSSTSEVQVPLASGATGFYVLDPTEAEHTAAFIQVDTDGNPQLSMTSRDGRTIVQEP